MSAETPPVSWFRRLTIAAPAQPSAAPAPGRRAALAKLAELMARDTDVHEPTGTRLLEPDQAAPVTIVIWHGFTNAPSQFLPIAEQLADAGHRVLLPRMPRHGRTDVLTKALSTLTADELVAHVNTCIDIAAGLGEQVWVVGLSAGGILSALAAATRAEVSRSVLIVPFVAPKGFPMPAVRLCVKFPQLVPRFYMWWDPRVKADLGQSPYAYPGFPLPGVIPFLHLSEAMLDGTVRAGHRLERVVLVTNPHDLAVRMDAARLLGSTMFAASSDFYGVASIDGALNWTHDFVDPWSPAGGSAEQVTAIVRAGLGIGEASAGGVLEQPLVGEPG